MSDAAVVAGMMASATHQAPVYIDIAIGQYFPLGFRNTSDNQFSERNFNTTWGIYQEAPSMTLQ